MSEKYPECPECGMPVEKCPECGMPVEKCPECGMPVQLNDTVCSWCGSDLSVFPWQEDTTQPMADVVGQTGDYTHKFLESEKNATFGGVGTEGSGKGRAGRNHRHGAMGILVPILVIALAVALVTILQMNKRLTELESATADTQVQPGSEGSDDEEATAGVGDAGNLTDAEAQKHDEKSASSTVSAGGAGDESPSASTRKKKYYGLIGTWTGTLQPTDRSVYCYGASEMPMVVEVKDVADTGMITADIHVCFHGHSRGDNSSAGTEGDRYIDYENMVLTYSNGRIMYNDEKMNEYPDKTCMLYIQLDVTDIDSDRPLMNGYVKCTYDLWDSMGNYGSQDDYYVFEKS